MLLGQMTHGIVFHRRIVSNMEANDSANSTPSQVWSWSRKEAAVFLHPHVVDIITPAQCVLDITTRGALKLVMFQSITEYLFQGRHLDFSNRVAIYNIYHGYIRLAVPILWLWECATESLTRLKLGMLSQGIFLLVFWLIWIRC